MADYGEYRQVKQLYTAPAGAVYQVEHVHHKGLYVVKTCQPGDSEWQGSDSTQNQERIDAFLESARVQQELAKKAHHFAPIHDFQSIAGGAYYVTDYYRSSIYRLILGRVALKESSLFQLIAAVSAGLREAQAHIGRGHGNLKPSNVLLAKTGPDSGSIMLADLAAKPPPGDDMQAVGELIYQLVQHAPLETYWSWPIPSSARWEALGPRGGRWLELCNRLLNPDATQRPADVERLAAEVNALASGSRFMRTAQKRAPKAAAIAAIVAVAAAAAPATMYWKSRSTVASAYSGWLGPLASAIDSRPQVRQEIAGDPALQPLLNLGALRLPPAVPHSVAEFSQVRGEADRVRQLGDLFSDQHWPAEQNLRQIQQRFAKQGWTQPAQYLQSLLASVPPAASADPAKSICAILETDRYLSDEQNSPEGVYNKINDSAARVNSSGKEDWQKITAAIIPEAQAEMDHLDLAARRIPDRLMQLAALSDELLAIAPKISLTEADYADANKMLRSCFPNDGGALSALVAGYLPLDVDSEKRLLQKQLDDIKNSLPTVPAAQRGDLSSRYQLFDTQVQDLHPLKREKAAFELTDHQISDGLSALWVDIDTAIHHDAVAHWLEALPKNPLTSSAALNALWSAALLQLEQEKPQILGKDQLFLSRRNSTDSWQKALQNLDKDFPRLDTLPADLPQIDDYKKAATAERDEAMLALISSRLGNAAATRPAIPIDSDPPTITIDGTPQLAAFTAWSVNLENLAKNYPPAAQLTDPTKIQSLLGIWFDKDESAFIGKEIDPDTGKLHGIAQLQNDLHRLRNLQAGLAITKPADLTKLALDQTTAPEVALAAWRQLVASNPAWPGIGDLHVDADIHDVLKKELPGVDALPDAAARLQDRWWSFLAAAKTEAAILEAVGQQSRFGIDDKNPPPPASFPPRTMFNYWFCRARQAALAGDPPAGDLTEHLKEACAALPPPDHAATDRLAAVLGTSITKDNIGPCFSSGWYLFSDAVASVPKEFDTAFPVHPVDEIAVLTAQAQQGDKVAMVKLGDLYRTGTGGAAVDPVQEKKYYTMAAQANDPDGIIRMQQYFPPWPPAVAIDKVKQLIDQANAGDRNAMMTLGEMYDDGNGVPKDQNTAATYYQMAFKRKNDQIAKRWLVDHGYLVP